MTTIPLAEAETQLSPLIDRAAAGEEIVIAKGDNPRVRLVPQAGHSDRQPETGLRPVGLHRGQVWMSHDFDEPLPPEIQRYFDGEDDGNFP